MRQDSNILLEGTRTHLLELTCCRLKLLLHLMELLIRNLELLLRIIRNLELLLLRSKIFLVFYLLLLN